MFCSSITVKIVKTDHVHHSRSLWLNTYFYDCQMFVFIYCIQFPMLSLKKTQLSLHVSAHILSVCSSRCLSIIVRLTKKGENSPFSCDRDCTSQRACESSLKYSNFYRPTNELPWNSLRIWQPWMFCFFILISPVENLFNLIAYSPNYKLSLWMDGMDEKL